MVAGRSLVGAIAVTVITLVFAFPYAYLMVRTPSSALRKFLLVALFLPFFIGQVVRAYGWLIILGNQGMVNEALGLVGVPPVPASLQLSGRACSASFNTCCPSRC